MKAIEIPNKGGSERLTHFKDVEEIKTRLNSIEAKINISDKVLEVLWYAFSESWCAGWLNVDDKTFGDFCDWAEDLSVEQAEHMDVYGNINY